MGLLDDYAKGLGLSDSQKCTVKRELQKLKEQRWDELNIRKLRNNVYRLKRGRIRIFYKKLPRGKFKILKIDLRNDNTYRGY